VRCKVVKNKVAPPFRQAEFDIMFTSELHGINRHADILDLAAQYEVVKKLGAFYSYGELRLGQGRQNSSTFLREHPEISSEIEGLVRAAAGLPEMPESSPASEEEAAEAVAAVANNASGSTMLPLDG